MENDWKRYLWDGRVLANGINPYKYKPLAPELDHLDTSYRQGIGWSIHRTIYPPVAQYLFALTHMVAPDSLVGLKTMLTLFDFLTGLIIVLWLKKRSVDPRWSYLYFLNPLVFKEVSNSAHLDSIAVFFMTLALYLFTSSKPKKVILGWGSLALAAGAKLFPVILIPFLAKLDPLWKSGVALFGLVMVIMYLPFMGSAEHLFEGAGAFSTFWDFNASLFTIIHHGATGLVSFYDSSLLETYFIKNRFHSKAIIALIFGLIMLREWRTLKDKEQLPKTALLILGWVLLLSPVTNAWYVLWVLPFAVLLKNWAWLSFSFLVVCAYSWFYSKDLYPYLRLFEYGIFFAFLTYYHFKERQKIMKLSVIVPVLNEMKAIEVSLERLSRELIHMKTDIQVTVVDSGSTDGTQALAKKICEQYGWHFLESNLEKPSIGRVLQFSLSYHTCSNLLFLPIDVEIPKKSWAILLDEITLAGGDDFYGAFLKKYNPTNWYLNFYTFMLNLYAKYPRNIVWTNGIFVKANLLKEVGMPSDGFLEDLILSDRLKATPAKFILIREKLTASSRRYINRGILKQQWANLKVMFMFRVLKKSPAELIQIYSQK